MTKCDNTEPKYESFMVWQHTGKWPDLKEFFLEQCHKKTKKQGLLFSKGWNWLCLSLGLWFCQEAQPRAAYLASQFFWGAWWICRTKRHFLPLWLFLCFSHFSGEHANCFQEHEAGEHTLLRQAYTATNKRSHFLRQRGEMWNSGRISVLLHW